MVFANKQDLDNVMQVSEVAEAIGLVKLKDRTWQIQECSALEGTGIKVKKKWIWVYWFIFIVLLIIINSFRLVIEFLFEYRRRDWTGYAKISKRTNESLTRWLLTTEYASVRSNVCIHHNAIWINLKCNKIKCYHFCQWTEKIQSITIVNVIFPSLFCSWDISPVLHIISNKNGFFFLFCTI